MTTCNFLHASILLEMQFAAVGRDSKVAYDSQPAESTNLSSERKWYQWYEPGASREENRLVFKLDVFILTFLSLSYFIKDLDQANVTNAYVSGMQADLKLYGSQLNWFTTFYNIGIIIGSLTITLSLTKLPAGRCLAICLFLNSLFVLFVYKATSAQTIYALRFFSGFFSGGILPGAFYLIGQWYRRTEIARRSVISMIAFYAGGMFSGYIQAGLINGMEGRAGLAAWRWLFVFDAIIGIAVALCGLIFCPDEPTSPRAFWLTGVEKEMAIRRLVEDGRHIIKKDFRFPGTVLDVLKAWQLWTFTLAYGLLLLTCNVLATTWMTLYLSSTGMYLKTQVNSIPTSISGLTILVNLLCGVIVDRFQNFALTIFVLSIFQIFGTGVLVVFPRDRGLLFAAYILGGVGYNSIYPLQNTWAAVACEGDRHLRASTLSLMSAIGYTVETIAQQHYFPANHAPEYRQEGGFVWALCWTVGMMIFTCVGIPVIEDLFKRRASRKRTADGTGESNDQANSTDSKPKA